MAPFYEILCSQFEWPVDAAFVQKMKAKNEEKVKELDSAVEDAQKNLGETEVRDFMLKKAEYFSRIGDKVTLVLFLVLVTVYGILIKQLELL